jgi:hypothetical protein
VMLSSWQEWIETFGTARTPGPARGWLINCIGVTIRSHSPVIHTIMYWPISPAKAAMTGKGGCKRS